MTENRIQEGKRYQFVVIGIQPAAESFPKTSSAGNQPSNISSPQTVWCHKLTLRIEEPGFEGNNLFGGQICTEEKSFNKFEANDLVLLSVKKISPRGTPTFDFISIEEKGYSNKNKSRQQPQSPVLPDTPMPTQEEFKYDGHKIDYRTEDEAPKMQQAESPDLFFAKVKDAAQGVRINALIASATLYQCKPHTTKDVIETAREFEFYLLGITSMQPDTKKSNRKKKADDTTK